MRDRTWHWQLRLSLMPVTLSTKDNAMRQNGANSTVGCRVKWSTIASTLDKRAAVGHPATAIAVIKLVRTTTTCSTKANTLAMTLVKAGPA